MDARTQNPADPSIGDLFHQLVDDGTNLFRAELNLYRQTAFGRIVQARTGMAAVVAGALVANAAITVALVGIAMGLARYIGPVGAGLAVASLAALAGYLLIRWGLKEVVRISRTADRAEAKTISERVL